MWVIFLVIVRWSNLIQKETLCTFVGYLYRGIYILWLTAFGRKGISIVIIGALGGGLLLIWRLSGEKAIKSGEISLSVMICLFFQQNGWCCASCNLECSKPCFENLDQYLKVAMVDSSAFLYGPRVKRAGFLKGGGSSTLLTRFISFLRDLSICVLARGLWYDFLGSDKVCCSSSFVASSMSMT